MELAAGSVFGDDYRIIRPLGQGGMGAVYLVEQISTGAQRALKLMHKQFAQDPVLRRRFEQEARVGAQIESDFVVLVLAAGVDSKSQMPWLAMELLQGDDLGKYVAQKGSLTASEALEVATPLCDALGAAHRVGVVHRDLKPENVFLAKPRRAGEKFTLKILDFGIAKLIAEVQTAATGALGTPLWMAPEQTSVGPQITPATDVWSFGLLMFWMLTGRRYWMTANTGEIALTALLREVVMDPLEHATARATRLGRDHRIPDGFDEWFFRCVVRDPRARFADADEAYEELAPLLRSGKDIPASLPIQPPAMVGKPATPIEVTIPSGGTGVTPPVATATPAASATQTASGFDVSWKEIAQESSPKFGEESRREKYGALPPLPESKKATEPKEPVAVTGGAASITAATPAPDKRAVPKWAVAAVGIVVAGGIGVWLAGRERHMAPQPTTPGSVAPLSPPSAPPSISASTSSSASAAALGIAEGHRATMITFPETSFMMGTPVGGADNEKPPHMVTLSSFRLDVTEVTAAAYGRCVASGACTPTATDEWCTGADPNKGDHPINCVTHVQATAYCAWRGHRLPTEREWELAAEGKDNRTFPWGDFPPQKTHTCWDRCTTKEGTCAVGSFPAGKTPEGLFDMSGNVWEWTSSNYCAYPSVACDQPRITIRGGGWCGNDPRMMRGGVRDAKYPNDKSSELGFRCARSL